MVNMIEESRRIRDNNNQFALAVVKYPMWKQHWPLTELRRIDREARKIMVTNEGKAAYRMMIA